MPSTSSFTATAATWRAVPPAVLQMGLIHMIGMTGTILGYLAPAGCRLARWGLWSNVILLVIFWLGIALSPI